MRTSRFVSLTPYCVVEYMFDQLNSTDFYTDNFTLLKNSYTNTHQIFNDEASYNTTKNIQGLSATGLGNNTYVYLDYEKIPNYLQYDSTNIVSVPINGHDVVMDQVRFHFVSGFSFDNFKALILTVKNPENDGKENIFANILLSPITLPLMMTFNPKPLFLGNALYDRYIDIFVPSIKNVNEDYQIALNQSTTFAAAITPTDTGYSGFINNSPILIGLSECGTSSTLYTNIGQTYQTYGVTEYFEASVSQSNEFDGVGAYINEASDGDYIDFYLTFNGGFPEDLISILNSRNPSADWIIVHQLSVFEQVGTDFINTSRFAFFQESAFDAPNVFRPVLTYANEAVSMSIDYIARLTNRQNGEQIIREGSFTLTSPKKYGRSLVTMPLLDKPQSHKIYNKLIQNSYEATKLFIEPALPSAFNLTSTTTTGQSTITKYVPIFFNNNNISISHASSLIKTSDKTDEVVFGPGQLRFVLSPFDNVIKLKVFTSSTSSSTTTLTPLDLNINSSTFKLVFDTDNGKISTLNANDSQLENLSTGVIVFKVSKADSSTIVKSMSQTVYLVSVAPDGTETLMYTGEWRNTSQQSDVDAAITAARDAANTAQNTQTALNQIIQKVTANEETLATKQLLDSNKLTLKPIAPASIVNKFGVTAAKGIQPTSSTVKDTGSTTTSQETTTSNKVGVTTAI